MEERDGKKGGEGVRGQTEEKYTVEKIGAQIENKRCIKAHPEETLTRADVNLLN